MSLVLRKATSLDHDPSKSPSKLTDLSKGLMSTTGALAQAPSIKVIAAKDSSLVGNRMFSNSESEMRDPL
jgi:hypothetical protein